jgi:phosphatidylglycerol---prolipoprotein diacylglyceryl transferase
MWIGRRFQSVLREGDLAGLYAIWYGVGRAWVEQLFRPDAWTLGALPTAVWVSVPAVVCGSSILAFNRLIRSRLTMPKAVRQAEK